jgi:hypothetical protein
MAIDAPARAGNFRILEAELFGVLSIEPLPATNLSFTTEPEPPPRLARASNAPLPGPFTDEQLLPAGVFETVVNFGQRVKLCVERKTATERGNAGRRRSPRRCVAARGNHPWHGA